MGSSVQSSWAADVFGGGDWFEVSILLGARSEVDADDRLRRALVWMWDRSDLEAAYHSPGEMAEALQAINDRDDGGVPSLKGVVTLPDGTRLAALTCVIRGSVENPESEDWLDLCIPFEGLGRAYPEVARWERRELAAIDTRPWREPLSAWLASVAMDLFGVVPFRLALIGREVSGSDEYVVDGSGTNPFLGYIDGGDDLAAYQPPTDWTRM